MSKPNLPKKTQEEALTDLLESIALEETALAHILNAEGEKIQAIVENIPFNAANTETIIKLQDSVRKTLRLPIKKEILLQFKLEDILKTKTKTETTTSTTTTSTSSTTQSTTTQSTTTQSTTSTSSTTTTVPLTQCCVKGSGGNLNGSEPWNIVSFEIGTDEDPICNCGGTITGTLGYYQARDNDPSPITPSIIYLEITEVTNMTCNNGSVTITGIGDEYDDNPGNGGNLIADDRSFELFLEEGSPDQLQMTILRSPSPDYVSGVVEITNGQINITDCPT